MDLYVFNLCPEFVCSTNGKVNTLVSLLGRYSRSGKEMEG